MPEVHVDFSQVEADEFSIVAPGEYDATVRRAFVKVAAPDASGKKKYPYIKLEMTIDEGQPFAGMTLFYNLASLSPEGVNPPIKRTKFLLLSMGIDMASGDMKFETGPEDVLLKPDLTGKPVHVWVNKRTYNDQPQANVYRVRGTRSVSGGNGTAAETAAEERYK